MLPQLRLSRSMLADFGWAAFSVAIFAGGVAIVTFNRAVSLFGSAAPTVTHLPADASILAIPVLGEVPTRSRAS
jgi:hypothetical protein